MGLKEAREYMLRLIADQDHDAMVSLAVAAAAGSAENARLAGELEQVRALYREAVADRESIWKQWKAAQRDITELREVGRAERAHAQEHLAKRMGVLHDKVERMMGSIDLYCKEHCEVFSVCGDEQDDDGCHLFNHVRWNTGASDCRPLLDAWNKIYTTNGKVSDD